MVSIISQGSILLRNPEGVCRRYKDIDASHAVTSMYSVHLYPIFVNLHRCVHVNIIETLFR
ncbi:hypothetical protein THTE_2259 [Thermogutta terrifontis]|uniref:Uncharacterized protein n=1 Tax=Thermogutta terrifontis TaxID=1331910 RepID=A0A286RFX1_9BACT|nr:hypothetical protein THTE_2259 [Thermogutta terrifontis]